jgi:hypothetical protein
MYLAEGEGDGSDDNVIYGNLHPRLSQERLPQVEEGVCAAVHLRRNEGTKEERRCKPILVMFEEGRLSLCCSPSW